MRSVLEQDYEPIEYVVVGDRAEPGRLDALRDLAGSGEGK